MILYNTQIIVIANNFNSNKTKKKVNDLKFVDRMFLFLLFKQYCFSFLHASNYQKSAQLSKESLYRKFKLSINLKLSKI